MIRHYRSIQDTSLELKYYEKLIEYFPANPTALNSYAWRMSELEINLEKALMKAQQAVELSSENPQSQSNILDTEAEILWKLGKVEDAIIIINRAIKINPEYEYFNEQKEKFLKSI